MRRQTFEIGIDQSPGNGRGGGIGHAGGAKQARDKSGELVGCDRDVAELGFRTVI